MDEQEIRAAPMAPFQVGSSLVTPAPRSGGAFSFSEISIRSTSRDLHRQAAVGGEEMNKLIFPMFALAFCAMAIQSVEVIIRSPWQPKRHHRADRRGVDGDEVKKIKYLTSLHSCKTVLQ